VCGDGVRFSVWAPSVRRMSVMLPSGAAAGEHRMTRDEHAVFSCVAPRACAGDDYFYRLDGERDRPDPVSRWQPQGLHGPSRVVDPTRFDWSDSAWRGIAMADVVLYELHVGTFTDAGTFDAVIPHIAWLRELGITALELMPVAQFPGTRNWGYDGAQLYAPQNSYGGPEGLRRLVDAAHAEGMAVFLDVVYNHLGPEGNYLLEYAPYFTDRYRTPWGEPLNLDGPESDEVRRFVVDNALYWATEYHMDGLRFDAADNLYDVSPRHLLEEIAGSVHRAKAAVGRRALLVGESDLNDPRLLRSPSVGGYGFDAQWLDDFHHAAHVALTGESQGYYADYQGVGPVARALASGYVYQGEYSPFRRRRRGASAEGIGAQQFVVFVQNHDQVGNRAGSERLSRLADLRAQRLGAALVLLSPFVPLLFMGEEYGETNPFFFFVSHTDPALCEAVRAGRTAEFSGHAWTKEIPDPGDAETMRRSRLDRSRMGESPHRELLALHRDLLRLRREEPALRPGDAVARVSHDEAAGWIRLELEHPSTPLVALFNFAGEPRRVPLFEPEGSAAVAGPEWTHPAGRVMPLISTEDPRYGGAEHGTADPDADGMVTLSGVSARLYRREPS
jgi:maltooligosyltrehalose trehalohydrolase